MLTANRTIDDVMRRKNWMLSILCLQGQSY